MQTSQRSQSIIVRQRWVLLQCHEGPHWRQLHSEGGVLGIKYEYSKRLNSHLPFYYHSSSHSRFFEGEKPQFYDPVNDASRLEAMRPARREMGQLHAAGKASITVGKVWKLHSNSSYLDEKGHKSHAHSSKSDEDITTKINMTSLETSIHPTSGISIALLVFGLGSSKIACQRPPYQSPHFGLPFLTKEARGRVRRSPETGCL